VTNDRRVGAARSIEGMECLGLLPSRVDVMQW
jgi:hypothetical protein